MLQLVRVPAKLSSAKEVADFWAARSNRALYDGPVVEARGVTKVGDGWRIEWSETTYSRYYWRFGGADYARGLHVSALILTTDGYLVVGEMNTHTVSAGRIQLPGGNFDPPERHERAITEMDGRAVLARELIEELGLSISPDELRLWSVLEGQDYGDVAVIFELTRQVSAEDVRKSWETLPHPREFGALWAYPLGGRSVPLSDRPAADILTPILAKLGGKPGECIAL